MYAQAFCGRWRLDLNENINFQISLWDSKSKRSIAVVLRIIKLKSFAFKNEIESIFRGRTLLAVLFR